MNELEERRPITVPSGIGRDEIDQRTLQTRDGIKLYYETVGDGDKTIVLANGLGGRLYSWGPILRAFCDQYQFVAWDYRGLFESEAPERIRRLSIQDHAEDLKQVMDAVGVDESVVVGWSMGVQVGLEFATLFPENLRGLVMLNGTYGKIFSSGFQPLFPLPYMMKLMHRLIEWFSKQDAMIQWLDRFIENNLDTIVNLQIALSPAATNRKEMEKAMRQYVTDVFATEFKNYLWLFQELDNHSVYHHLPNIKTPALIISGGLDLLTPPYQSRDMNRRMPNSRHKHICLANHFAMLEYPETVVDEIRTFLKEIDF